MTGPDRLLQIPHFESVTTDVFVCRRPHILLTKRKLSCYELCCTILWSFTFVQVLSLSFDLVLTACVETWVHSVFSDW